MRLVMPEQGDIVWTCYNCGTEVPVPIPPRGIIQCTKADEFGNILCGYGYDLDAGGLANLNTNKQKIDPSSGPIRLTGDCDGCTPEESEEFRLRFPELDEIDREFRQSR